MTRLSLFKRIIKKYNDITNKSEEAINKKKIKLRNEVIQKYYKLEKDNKLNTCLACKHQVYNTYAYDIADSITCSECELGSPFYSSDLPCDKKCRYFELKDEIVLGKTYLEEDKKYLEEKDLIDPPLEHHHIC